VNDALVRLEYKIDCIMQALMDKGLMVADLPRISGITRDDCPVCGIQIALVADFETETPVYKCGCTLPISIVPGISNLIPQRETHVTDIDRNSEDHVPPQHPPEGDRNS
jgi:hypothetical protein